MSTRILRALPLLLMLAASIAVLSSTTPAAAQAATPDPDDSCLSCHEQLYRLHDIGKAFCLCGAPMNCTCCHGGVTGELDEEAAHLGMVANPLTDNAPPCQSCHPDDFDARQAIFAARAGLGATPCPTMEAFVAALVPPAATVSPTGLEAWQIAVLSLLGLALVALVIFAYRCWKADCLAKGAQS
jgi:hypothetical protein